MRPFFIDAPVWPNFRAIAKTLRETFGKDEQEFDIDLDLELFKDIVASKSPIPEHEVSQLRHLIKGLYEENADLANLFAFNDLLENNKRKFSRRDYQDLSMLIANVCAVNLNTDEGMRNITKIAAVFIKKLNMFTFDKYENLITLGEVLNDEMVNAIKKLGRGAQSKIIRTMADALMTTKKRLDRDIEIFRTDLEIVASSAIDFPGLSLND